MDLRKIKTLIELLEASNLSEIEISEGDDSIRLSRAAAINPAPIAVSAVPIAPAVPAGIPAAQVAVAAAPAAVTGHVVESPTVGTFYSRSSPDAEAFVSIGASVEVGSTLCVVEAMKTFNEIKSDKAGVITAILKDEGDPVEFGEALFTIS